MEKYHAASSMNSGLLCVEQVLGCCRGSCRAGFCGTGPALSWRVVSDTFKPDPAQDTAERSTGTAGGTSVKIYLRQGTGRRGGQNE